MIENKMIEKDMIDSRADIVPDKKPIDWSHFASRTRKDENGNPIYDRLFIDWRINSYDFLREIYQGAKDNELAHIMILGIKNIIFVHKDSEKIVYANSQAGARARQYIDFYATQAGAKVVYVDNLPTSAKASRAGNGGIKSLADLCRAAASRQADIATGF